jgi:hypothetical protein
VNVGIRVHVRDVETLEDVDDLSAPEPVEPGDLFASVEDVYGVEVVLTPPPGARVISVLARRIELAKVY